MLRALMIANEMLFFAVGFSQRAKLQLNFRP